MWQDSKIDCQGCIKGKLLLENRWVPKILEVPKFEHVNNFQNLEITGKDSCSKQLTLKEK